MAPGHHDLQRFGVFTPKNKEKHIVILKSEEDNNDNKKTVHWNIDRQLYMPDDNKLKSTLEYNKE